MVFIKGVFHTLALLILSGLAGAQAGDSQEKIPDQYLVKFSSPVSSFALQELNNELGLSIEKANQLSGSLFTKGKLNEPLAKALLSKGLLEYIEPNYRLTRNKKLISTWTSSTPGRSALDRMK